MGSCSRTGSLIVGITEIIVYGLVLILSGLLWVVHEFKREESLEKLKDWTSIDVKNYSIDKAELEWFPVIAIIVIVFFSLLLISAIVLVVGVRRSSTCLLKIWMIIKGLSDLVYIGLAVAYFMLGNEINEKNQQSGKPSTVPYIILAAALVVDAIFISVVCLFHRHLKAVEFETKDYDESI